MCFLGATVWGFGFACFFMLGYSLAVGLWAHCMVVDAYHRTKLTGISPAYVRFGQCLRILVDCLDGMHPVQAA